MSAAIAGVVKLDGAPSATEELKALLTNQEHWAAGTGTATIGAASFGYVGSGFQPFTTPNGWLVTAAARLDNRDDLATALGFERGGASSPFDAGLVAAAFERWGDACCARLNGDWALAAWSPSTRRLFLARDHFGNAALHYARHGASVAFASDLNALLALTWLPRTLNELRLASLLTDGGQDTPAFTAYREIARLPPAHTISMGLDGERVVRYWRVEDTPDAGPQSPDERAELLRATLRAAVASRLETCGHVGSLLSGGLDSGAVTALAAEFQRDRGHRLTAFTAVPAFPGGASGSDAACTNEGPGAAAVATAFACIDHVLEAWRPVSPLAGIARALEVIGEPSVPAANMGWTTRIMADAQARGVQCLLTGQVGDFVMAGRPRRSDWRRDWSAGRYRPVVRRALPGWLLRLRRAQWRVWRPADWTSDIPPLMNRQFAAETRFAEYQRDHRQEPVARVAMSHIGAIWAPLSAAYGLTILDPLQDKRVMEQMFSGPRPDGARGTDRWLFRESMKGVLPEPVRLSRIKGIQSADIVQRLAETWTEVEDALAQAEASPLAGRVLDLRHCRALAGSIRTDRAPARARRSAFRLLDALSMASFLVAAR